jgi:hypothetical protein
MANCKIFLHLKSYKCHRKAELTMEGYILYLKELNRFGTNLKYDLFMACLNQKYSDVFRYLQFM